MWLAAMRALSRMQRSTTMTYVTTLDVMGLTAAEYRAVLDELGVEKRPESGIYLHLTTPIEGGFRIVEIWDRKEGFEEFLRTRLAAANKKLGIDRIANVTITPLHNLFGPRLKELPGLVPHLPGAPTA
jgi:hypothetical protein